MQAVESNDVESLTLHFKETDDKLWTEIVEQLIISAAQMDLNGYTALMITTFADRGAAAELICKCPDVDVDYPDARNRTAFSYAALYGAEHCAQVLAAAGADVYVRDFEDKDPLELANESGGKPSCIP
ncbi:uncharacterized protein HaLaN_29690, partial [Haematococcus lacustris]